jgi:hypothetical protein
LSNLLQAVAISIWYDWKNGEDVNERLHHFGTVTYDLQPKPGYVAIQTLPRELSGYRIASRRNAGNRKDFALILKNTNVETKLAVWTVGKPHTFAFDLEAAPATELYCGGAWEKRKNRNRKKQFHCQTFLAYITLKDVPLK